MCGRLCFVVSVVSVSLCFCVSVSLETTKAIQVGCSARQASQGQIFHLPFFQGDLAARAAGLLAPLKTIHGHPPSEENRA